MFNPLKYRYKANFVGEEAEDFILQVTQGSVSQMLRFPKQLFPPNINTAEGIQIALQPNLKSDETDIDTLKSLLQDLIG